MKMSFRNSLFFLGGGISFVHKTCFHLHGGNKGFFVVFFVVVLLFWCLEKSLLSVRFFSCSGL